METKALKLRPVKRLFEHLLATNRLLINPTEGLVETSRKNRKIPPVLTVQEVRDLMQQPNLSLQDADPQPGHHGGPLFHRHPLK